MNRAHKILLLVILLALLPNGLAILFNTDIQYSQVTIVGTPFVYSFNVDGTLNESNKMAESDSPYWWLNSGGVMVVENSIGRTNMGNMSGLSRWRLLYRINNPRDTDQGFHPQNIFRLVTRNTWKNFSEQLYFRIVRDNLSESENRNISNGILLMSRYEDENNLYYSGLRVDGTAVIKKKREGEYTTLAQEKVLDGTYERYQNPNLLPKNRWIGIRNEVENIGDTVVLRLFVDMNENGVWQKVLEVHDSTKVPGEETRSPIFSTGFAGIRTDFMDVEFKDFRVLEI